MAARPEVTTGSYYGKIVSSTEIQQLNTTLVQTGQSIPALICVFTPTHGKKPGHYE